MPSVWSCRSVVGRLCRRAGVVVLFVLVLPGSSALAAAGDSRVAVHITTKGTTHGLRQTRSVRWQRGAGRGGEMVRVDAGRAYQRLTAGFGVAMTDTSAWLLRTQLPAAKRDQAMRRLFTRRAGGIGLSYLRVPVGGSDYIVGQPYTYDDRPAGRQDPTLAAFSTAHDDAYVLPAIRQALSLNKRMTVMANPWSPPAWMKADDSIIPTSATASTLRPDAFRPYADYLVRFLDAYRRAGVPVHQLGVANEPTNTFLTQSFPQMYLPAGDEVTLVNRYVKPALKRAGLDPELLLYDFIYPKGPPILQNLFPADQRDYVDVVARGAGRNAGGLALHCYLTDAASGSTLHRRYPRLAQYETECSSYLSQIEPAQMAIRVLRNWGQGVQLWNAAVDQGFGPKVGAGCKGIFGPHAGQDCIAPYIVDTATHAYRPTSDFWAIGQFSRFIDLGARRIASTTPSTCHDGRIPIKACGLEDVAFLNPDGTRVVVATANDGKPHRLRLVEGDRHATVTVPDGAVVTYTWR